MHATRGQGTSAAPTLGQRTESVTFRRSKRQGLARSVAERYTREDIPCGLHGCSVCTLNAELQRKGVPQLSGRISQVLVPDASVVSRFIGLLEQADGLKNMVFCQTIVEALDRRNRTRTIRNVRRIANDPTRSSVVFANEVFAQTRASEGGEKQLPSAERDMRAVLRAARWYRFHLDALARQQVQVVLLTLKVCVLVFFQRVCGLLSAMASDLLPHLGRLPPNFADAHAIDYSVVDGTGSQEGVEVWQLADFIETFHPSLLEHFRSVESATRDGDMDITAQSPEEYAQGRLRAKAQGSYAAYYSPGDIEAGLRSGTLVRGKIRLHPVSSFRPETQGVVERGGDVPDIIITGRAALNRACIGDIVVVKLLAEMKGPQADAMEGADAESEEDEDEVRVVEQTDAGEETPLETATRSVTGVVVGVAERRWRPYVATLQIDEAGGMQHLAVPVDASVPKIRIHYMDVSAINDRYFVVAIDGWTADSVYPQGHFVRALGPVGSLDAEIDTILVERQIAVSQAALGFSEASMREMPIDTSGRQWRPSAEEISSRRDLRSTLIFSIDPIGSQDIDDAVSMRRTKDGYELGVHIADVTQFIAPGSATDSEALARGTTVYLADRRFNMIPEVLSERVCSLRGGRDRYAVSVVWKLDEEYHIKDVWFGRSVICSACEMSYEQAQALLDGKVGVEGLESTKEDALRTGVVELTRAMRVLRERRRAAGALELASTEVKFGFESGTQRISELAPKRSLEIHRVIEEAMVFANTAVARRVHQTLPSAALLRRHRSPTAERFERLAQAVRTRGFEIDSSSNAALAASLQTIAQASADKEPQLEFLAKAMATLAMQEAEYFATGDCASSAEFVHYGLAQEYYTHFTSPIRRYADIIVHRQLLAALENPADAGAEEMSLSRQWVSKAAGQLNERSRQSKLAQREATELFQSRYVAQKTADGQSLVADGVVAEVRTNGLIVYVPRFGLRGPVRLRDTAGQIRLPLSALTGSARDIDRFVDGCSDFAAETSSLSMRLPMNAPVFHLGSPVLRFAVFDRVKVALRVLETRRRRAPVFLTLVSRGAVGAAEAKAYRSTLAPLDRTLRVSAAGRQKVENSKDSSSARSDDATVLRPSQSDTADPANRERDFYAVLDKFRAMSILETKCDVQKL
ncbi:hypothetical protein H4R20_003290 [Coemansia guatemalensis]|uniref:DIS3-like exonuclease 1 n=1 Tax=Coemansia guatemalensis TaxID=2761395 RepID=A0A9W8I0W6_9FUNG|nr:hypothetical protein H4R20_003290 [Coemansia guatemalensis]